MPTIVSGTVPADDLALNHSLKQLPDLVFEVERIVTSGDDAVMPMLWVRGSSRETVQETLSEDPTVDDVTVLGDFDGEWLFQMKWISRVDLIIQMITNSEATVLDAVGRDNHWRLRVLYPRRSLFSKTHDFCEEHSVDFDVSTIRELDEEPAGRYGLTNAQYEILSTASSEGYFKVPREASLSDLADELGITHQAASERLRRGADALIEDVLFVDYQHDG